MAAPAIHREPLADGATLETVSRPFCSPVAFVRFADGRVSGVKLAKSETVAHAFGRKVAQCRRDIESAQRALANAEAAAALLG